MSQSHEIILAFLAMKNTFIFTKSTAPWVRTFRYEVPLVGMSSYKNFSNDNWNF